MQILVIFLLSLWMCCAKASVLCHEISETKVRWQFFRIPELVDPVRTVKVVGKVLRRHPLGDQVLLRRIGDKWHSSYRSDLAVQGDPTLVIQALGEKAARVLGFELLSDHELLVPTPELLNRAIERINYRLPEGKKIVFRFYQQLQLDRARYNHLLGQRRLPLRRPTFLEKTAAHSTNNNLFVHDIANHPGVITLPEPVAREIADYAHKLANLIESLEGDIPTRSFQSLHFQVSVDLDLAVAGQLHAIVSSKNGDKSALDMDLYDLALTLRNWATPSALSTAALAPLGKLYPLMHPIHALEMRRLIARRYRDMGIDPHAFLNLAEQWASEYARSVQRVILAAEAEADHWSERAAHLEPVQLEISQF